MPLTTEEGIKDGFAALQIGQTVIAAVQALPPKGSRTAVDYAKAFGADPAGVQMKIAVLIDQVEADIKS